MEYKGKLYGKIGNKYINLEVTADDYDKLVEESQKRTIDKLKLISTLANFQEQKRVAMDVLVNVQQLIIGWKGTVTKEEWSEFDEKTLQDLSKLMTDIYNSLPKVGEK